MLQNYATFFNFCNRDMMNKNEQIILYVLRVIWNSSYKNQVIQDYYGEHLNIENLGKLISHPHASVRERVCGVIQNLTSLSDDNSAKFMQIGIMKSLCEKILKQKANEWHFETLLSALGILGNISSSQKMT